MARPVKDGLDYFPKDTDYYRDRKIRALIGRYGCDGAALYDYILCEAYRDKGYYAEVDEAFNDIAAADLGMSPEKIGLILDYLLNKSMLLDGTLFKVVKVLTSRGIQARWQEAKKSAKRAISVDGRLWLLEKSETEGFVKVCHNEGFSEKNHSKSEKNHGFSAEESLKESKGKEIKVKERKGEELTRPPARVSIPTFEQVMEIAKLRGCPECAQPFFDYYDSGGWRDGEGKPVFNWQQKFVLWQQRQLREEKRQRPRGKDHGASSSNVFLDMLREEEERGQN